jgi:hypothetical protein
MAVTTLERKRIRWLALLLILAVFGVLGWYFGWLRMDPVVVSTVVL